MQGDGKIISNTHPSLARIFTAITFALLATPKRSPTAVALCVVMIYIERDVVSLGWGILRERITYATCVPWPLPSSSSPSTKLAPNVARPPNSCCNPQSGAYPITDQK